MSGAPETITTDEYRHLLRAGDHELAESYRKAGRLTMARDRMIALGLDPDTGDWSAADQTTGERLGREVREAEGTDPLSAFAPHVRTSDNAEKLRQKAQEIGERRAAREQAVQQARQEKADRIRRRAEAARQGLSVEGSAEFEEMRHQQFLSTADALKLANLDPQAFRTWRANGGQYDLKHS